MKRDNREWNKWVAKQKGDPYSVEIFNYAERWADLMEAEMGGDYVLPPSDVIKRLSHEADTTGITGFMYGASVSVPTHTWEYGEQLRRWHNLDI